MQQCQSSLNGLAPMKWLDTWSAEQSGPRTAAFWAAMSEGIRNGTFWADRIRELRGEPLHRLQYAIDQLPLPAAFREAAISVRALVRARLKLKQLANDELVVLYWLAAVESFGVPYSAFLQQPGYNVLESVPGAVIKSLPFSYVDLGYNQLRLLNKTDVKWLIGQWGEPEGHSTLNAMHRATWEVYERKLAQTQRLDLNRSILQLGG